MKLKKVRIMINWDAITAIGTITAAIVGVSGIWINYYEKTKRLSILFQIVPKIELIISNNSTRSVAITKMIIEIKDYIFYAEYYTGLQQLIVPPASTEAIVINSDAVKAEYKKLSMESLCSKEDTIIIILYDNYKRRYKVKTNLPIQGLY